MAVFVSLIALSTSVSNAQTFRLNPKTFSMVISGTTNVHDFETKVTQMSGELVINGSKQVQSMVVNVPVRSIKSNEKLMDTKTYETFNDEKYPNITFRMVEVNSLQVNGNDVSVVVTGNLTMAGVTRKITLKPVGKNIKPGAYQFKGSVDLKMSDFKMKPPTAMLGMMKVGDGIKLKYDVTFEGTPAN
ncbi:MAG TPA: YceI family protein [Paludibacter sp.]|nr:YceI family protein [Paludibacter sp.]